MLRVGTLTGVGSAQPPATLAWFEPSDLHFGNVALGQTAQRTARLINTSTLPAQVARLRVTGQNASRFALETDCPAGSRIEGGAGCEVRVRFAPQVAGAVEAWVEIESDATNAPLARVSASGVSAPSAPSVPPPDATTPPGGGGALAIAWTALLAAATRMLRQRRRR